MLRRVQRSVFALLIGLVVTASAACGGGGGGSPGTTAPTTSAGSSGSVTITTVDFKFEPRTVSASTSQSIVLVNKGNALHNFSIEGTTISVDVAAGKTMTLTPPGPSFKPGTYTFFCKYHRALGMTGTLTAASG